MIKHFLFFSIPALMGLFIAVASFAQYVDEGELEDFIEFSEPLDTSLEPSEIMALLHEALEDVGDEEYGRAIPKLERIIEERPSMVPAWEALGWAYWKMGRRDEAIRLWNDLLKLNPQIAQAYNLLGMASTGQDDLDQAIIYYEKSLSIDSQQFHPRLSLARIHRWRGHLNESVRILEQLLAEDPDRLDIRLELGRALLQNWQFAEAEPHWKIMLEASPDTIEYQMAMATVMLNRDRVDEADNHIRRILRRETDHIGALTLLADIQEYGDQPQRAIPTLKRLVNLADSPALLHQLRTRLVRLYVRLYRQDKNAYPLDDAIVVVEAMVEADVYNTDTRLLLGELNSMNLRFAEAEKHLLYVLEHLNPNNQRARRGLFEVYLGRRDFAKAWEQFERIRAFNPNDPYLNYRLARYEAARGRFYQAYEALEELERRGREGAVAVMLYHAISPSDWSATPSVRRLSDQMAALKKAGFRFITPDELPAYFNSGPSRSARDGFGVDKVVMITFDDALRSSMKYGTQVAREHGVRFAQFVITGFTEREDPFVSTWDELKAYQQTGVWSFQSQLFLAEQISPINEHGTLGLPLGNRLWLEDQRRLETIQEYEARIRHDYQHSRALLRHHFGTPDAGRAVAYPLGEIGQETASNVDHAIPFNLATAAEHYELGFLQTPFGYAVKGDHPFLYHRHELHRSAEGTEMLAHVMENHPVLLAERMRAEFAALEGKTRRANHAIGNLKEAGYPEESLKRVETYVKERTARRFAVPPAAERARKGFLGLEFSNPYVGAETRYFQDNLDRRNWRQSVLGGLNVMPRLTLEGRAGWGQLRQKVQEPPVEGIPQPRLKLKVDEAHAGLRGAYVISDHALVSVEAEQRRFSGDADWNPFTYAIEGFFRPFVILDTFIRYEHDAVDSARSVVEQVTYDMIGAHGIVQIMDWWSLTVSGMYYDFSDGNDRKHVTLANQWLVWEQFGLHLGLRYGYVTSDEDRSDYWTPYKLHRYYLEAILRKNYMRIYYNIGARIGVGRQAVRPEARAAYAETVERARRLQFDPGDAPSQDWEAILGLLASTRIRLGGNWELNGEVSYNRLPDYNELNMNAGIKYRF